ncbi:MAG: SRPBCC family protein [Haloarculaceae archaeon]
MQTVSVTRTIDADRDAVEAAMLDVEPFMEAAGFDAVRLDGDALHIENGVGLATIELDLTIVDREGAVLAYVQDDGIFREMETRYTVADTADGVEVEATTTFAVDIDLVGMLLDATVIKRQRRKELTAQFDYLDDLAPVGASSAPN